MFLAAIGLVLVGVTLVLTPTVVANVRIERARRDACELLAEDGAR